MILAIDTAGSYASVALGAAGVVRSCVQGHASNSHADQLDVLIRECFAAAGVNIDQIDAIVLGSGPGSFTGLRIGFAMTQGLALMRGLPVFLIPSAIGARAARVLAPAGKGLVFESIFAAGAANSAAGATGFAAGAGGKCEMKRVEDVVAWTQTGELQPLALAPIAEFPELQIAQAVAQGLLLHYFLVRDTGDADGAPPNSVNQDSHDRSGDNTGAITRVTDLAAMQPQYLREVAAKTIAERRA